MHRAIRSRHASPLSAREPAIARLVLEEVVEVCPHHEGHRHTGNCCHQKDEEAADKVDLDAEQHALYRSLIGRLQYMCEDRPDIQYSVKECAREMSKPTMGAAMPPLAESLR